MKNTAGVKLTNADDKALTAALVNGDRGTCEKIEEWEVKSASHGWQSEVVSKPAIVESLAPLDRETALVQLIFQTHHHMGNQPLNFFDRFHDFSCTVMPPG